MRASWASTELNTWAAASGEHLSPSGRWHPQAGRQYVIEIEASATSPDGRVGRAGAVSRLITVR
jgi:hypothetical protein